MQVEVTTPNLHSFSGQTINHQQLFKFGGSSLKDSDAIKVATDIVNNARDGLGSDLAVVVSANGKNTDRLIELCATAKEQQPALLNSIVSEQKNRAERLLNQEVLAGYLSMLDQDTQTILTKLNISSLNRQDTNAEIIAFGEIWSAKLFALKVENAIAVDTRQFLTFNPKGFCESTSFSKLNKLKERLFQSNNKPTTIIFTGFIAADYQGNTMLLGRNGSDYSASLLGVLLGVSKVTFWTDVNGVFTADPNKVKKANQIAELSFANALTLSQLGSPVLHHRTLSPLLNNHIELEIKCPQKQAVPGTVISQLDKSDHEVQSIVHVQEQLYIVPLHELPEDCPIVLHYEATNGDVAIVTKEHLSNVNLTNYRQVKLVSVIGKHNAQLEQAFTEFFKTHSSLCVVPEQFITIPNALIAIVPVCNPPTSNSETSENIEQHLHDYLESLQTKLTVGLIGPGNVGKEVLRLLSELAQRQSSDQDHLNQSSSKQTNSNQRNSKQGNIANQINVALIADSKNILEVNGTKLKSAEHQPNELTLAENVSSSDLDVLSKKLRKLSTSITTNTDNKNLPNRSVIIDTTASDLVAARYSQFLTDGHSIVTANKIAGASRFSNYQLIKQSQGAQHWLYEATVGAGLPLISTIKNLIRSGDRIRKIEAVCSGSLAWIFQQYSQGTSFTDAILQAQKLGFTEPDPRIDLSGLDIARKAVILIRECLEQDSTNNNIEVGDINLPNWLPQNVLDQTNFDWTDSDNLAQVNSHFDAQAKSYVAQLNSSRVANAKPSIVPLLSIDFGSLRDSLKGIKTNNSNDVTCSLYAPEPSSAFFGLNASDNLFAITTDFYPEQPLIIRGPGAGPTVTASAIVSDLLSLIPS